ncbi:MAG: TonB-dependent receptor [Bacteroidetes bacterium]|nr:MAG: TonB-dependent receptor [Bacteroidota bacterium]
MHTRRLIIIFWILMAQLGGTVVQAQCNHRLFGRVTDADTHEVLQGAVVTIGALRLQVLTDSLGAFSLPGLCVGTYDIEISHISCGKVAYHIHLKGDARYDVQLPHAANALADVNVVGSSGSKGLAIGGQIKGRALEAKRGLSLAESLQEISGVSILQTGTNIYKPVIHGLHSNRVLILNNGIRQEGQQWGSEHAPEVDAYIANRLSVIKGASTLRYGADAIGGVVLVEPRLLPAVPGICGELNLAAFSNNAMGVVSGIVEGNLKKHPAFAWRLQGTAKRGGNARTPQYWLANSGITEFNFSATAGWRMAHKGVEIFFSQFNTELGIFSGSHIGNTTDLITAINSGRPVDFYTQQGFTYAIDRPKQVVQHNLVKVKAFINTGKASRLNVVLSTQYNSRMEYDVKRFQAVESGPQLDIGLLTTAADVVWDHYKGEKWRGTIGTTASYQANDYFRRFFIPNYKSVNLAAFAIEKYSTGPWEIEAGLRYDYRSLYDITRNNGANFANQNFGSATGNVSVNYKPGPRWLVQASANSAWRPPQVNELFSDGLHHGAARIEKGDQTLKAERANGLMTQVNYQGKRLVIEVTGYVKWIDNFIYLRPTYPPQLTIRGAFPSFLYAQTNTRLHGLDALVQYAISQHLQWSGKASLVRAWNLSQGDWLIQMPPDRLENALTYTFGGGTRWTNNYVKLMVTHVARQTRVPASGNIEIMKPNGSLEMASDYAPPPPSYMLLGAEAGTTVMMGKKPVGLVFTGTNLTNNRYRDYMNAFRYFTDEMGINVAVKVKVPLGKPLTMH